MEPTQESKKRNARAFLNDMIGKAGVFPEAQGSSTKGI